MNVLVLMHFPVHVGVSVCVNVGVEFRVDFRGRSQHSLAEEELLLGQVLLVVHGAHAVFLWVGGSGQGSGAGPVPLSMPVGAVQSLWSRSAGRGAVFSALAEPQQNCGEDEHDSRRDADDDGPGEGAGGCWESGHDGRLCV